MVKSCKRKTSEEDTMAKFIKSIFHSPATEKSKNMHHDADTEGESDSPISDRRKLSMSRSGRLKHAYKKRHSLSLELYGTDDIDIQPTEKQKSKEYHVNTPVTPPEPQLEKTRKKDSPSSTVGQRHGDTSPEDEIDTAFEVIDKS